MRADDETDFRAFVAARSATLLRTAYLLTGDRHLAEDLLQTALTNTYVAWWRIRDPNAREAYVRRALVRERTSFWRRRRNHELPHADVGEPGAAPDHAGGIADRDPVLRALATLPARQRAVVVLRYFDDLTETQAAAALGCSVGTIKSQHAAALAKLRLDPALVAATGGSEGGTR